MFNHNCMALHCAVYASFSASGKKIHIMMFLKDISVQMKSPVAAVSITISWCFQIHTAKDHFTYKAVTML